MTPVRLAIVYHRPYYQDHEGDLWEAEGSFSRYVEAMARHADEILLLAPRLATPGTGPLYRLNANNVRLVPLPFFDSLPRFYRNLPRILIQLWRGLSASDLVNLRVPTWPGIYAFLLARLRRRPIFLLVVGDLDGVARSVRPTTLKRALFRAFLWQEARWQEWMVARAPTFVNGQALYARYNRPGRRVLLTTTSTISRSDIRANGERESSLERWPAGSPIRVLCVSRVDPRKGLRYLPAALADLVAHGHDVRLSIVGPIVGRLGEQERARVAREAASLGVSDRVVFLGPKTLTEVLAICREHDLFVLPTLPGEGVPRVLLEAMASGLPIVASDVAGVPTLVAHGVNGLLVPPGDSREIASAMARLIRDADLRSRLVQNGYTVARAHTVDAHANKIVLGLRKLAGIELRPTRRRPDGLA